MHFRELKFGRADPKARTVPVTISTETPIDRGDFVEILDHSPGAVDLSRGPLPIIESHDASQLNIGIVESLTVEGGRLRGVARFGESERAKEVFADIESRVVRGVSVGYELLDRGKPVEHPSGRARKFRFRPYEVSAVAVPADIQAGFYRSERNVMQSAIEQMDREEGQQSRSQRRGNAYEARSEVNSERERASNILALATSHNLRDLGERHVHEGTSLELFRGLVLDELQRRGGNNDRPLYNPANEIGLSQREAQRFSVTRFIRSLVERDRSIAPFEHECARTVSTQLERVGIRSQHTGGSFIPHEVLRQPIPGARVVGDALMVGNHVLASTRDLSTGSVSAGGAMVATDLLASEFIDLLRNRVLVRLMGARVLSGLVGNVAIPRQTAAVTGNWVAQGGAAAESDSAFAVVTLAPKTIHGMQDVTRDLLLQGTPTVEGLIRADLLNTMAVQIDFASLHGTGASNQPTGLANTAGIGSEVGGTNGAAPTWDNVVNLEGLTSNANSFDGMFGYLTNAKARAKLKRTQKFASTNGQEIWGEAMPGDSPGLFGKMNGYRAGVSNNVRSDLTKGTSSGVCSAIFWGCWSDLLIGEWGVAEILPDPYTQATNRIVRMHVYQTVDVAVRRPQSFAAMVDALTL